MNTAEIKKKLIREIETSKDKKLLEELYSFLNLNNETEDVFQLSSQMESAISEARKQVESGNYLTDDQANKEFDKWLKR